jgi:hypothetical protein
MKDSQICFIKMTFIRTIKLSSRRLLFNSSKISEPAVLEGTSLSAMVPLQITQANIASILDKTVSCTIYCTVIGAVTSNIFLKTSLLSLWGLINNLQLMGVLSVVSIPVSGDPSILIRTILKIASIDLIPIHRL